MTINNSPNNSEQDTLVKETVKDLLALRQLSRTSRTVTTRSQNQLLRELDSRSLARVARILAEIDNSSNPTTEAGR